VASFIRVGGNTNIKAGYRTLADQIIYFYTMIVYNVTINIDAPLADEWVLWMKDIHIPQVMQTGMFSRYEFFRLLTRQEDEEGITYVVQYFTSSMENYERYQSDFAPALQAETRKLYEGKFHAFRSVMEEVG
jgi:hypothetical protein